MCIIETTGLVGDAGECLICTLMTSFATITACTVKPDGAEKHWLVNVGTGGTHGQRKIAREKHHITT